ncbi:type VI secretion system membrane subunit TssM [Sphingomonas morindae]|uniref:Type VI secretion system membrane subunit TssM n=1 Tax=Sphingomonas morindae TaxID=1541170 RepID=A0ABY4XDS2_9SPHN|nr:type VI secretion system membrane subunit TssM [Sphingomonas morindae]USI75067.1 type VI secretion system membrane subunit TssM [Sphingomonas morindae]
MQRIVRGWWTLAGTSAMVMGLVLAVGLPALVPALRAPWVRLALLALVALGFALAAGYRIWTARRRAARLADALAPADTGDAAADETRAVTERMRAALARLRADGRGRAYLYAKPWYLLIGPPGAGKTTALLQSGLRFPWSDGAVPGLGGTRALDVWLGEDAVLVDTAGRYTTQDSDAAVDAAGWQAFLRLLRRTRPLQPINGILVTLGIDMLTGASRAELDAHAGAVRRRLDELRRTLRVSAPVYILFAKTDLLAGFTEFFADLDAEGRRAVLGATLPLAGAGDLASVMAGFDTMIEAVTARSARRLQDEADQRRRSLILGFPPQLIALRARVARFVEGVLPATASDGHRLRGLYFASGVQAGAPLDRVLSAMAELYEPDRGAPAPGSGRAYFLNRLLTELVIPEAGLASADPALRRRRRLQLGGGVAALALLGLAVTGLWARSFAANSALQTRLTGQGQEAIALDQAAGIDLARVGPGDPDLQPALPLLERLRTLARGYADQQQGPPPRAMRFGLFQAGHADAARQAYLDALQRVLLPRLLLRLEAVMRAEAAQPERLYEPLKAYLMLGGYGRLDRDAVRAWVVEDWRTAALPGADRADLRDRLARHLDALLADPDLGRVWPGRRAPLDGRLIADSRAAVQTLSLGDRAYAVLRQRAAASGAADWRADRLLASGDARAFANGAAVLQLRVPWFFTRQGYARAYRPGLLHVEAELDRNLWVLGPDAERATIRAQLPAMRAAVAQDYARDYMQAWDAVVATPQPGRYFADRAGLAALVRTPSPLAALLREVRRNTQLDQTEAAGGAAGDARDAAAQIAAHFADLDRFAGAPVDGLVGAIRQAAAATTATAVPGAALDGGAVQGRLAGALGDLSAAGLDAPAALQPFVAGALRGGQGAAARTADATLNQAYAATVRPACLDARRGGYPFVREARQDAGLADVQRVWGANGAVDGFVRDRLAPLLVTGTRTWRWRADDPVAARFAPASAMAFQKAAALRDLLAGGVTLSVTLAGLGPGLDAVELASGGTSYRLDRKDATPHVLIWAPTALPEAHVALLGGGARVLRRDAATGPWALFHLLDAAHLQPAGPGAMLASFGEGDRTARLLLRLSGPGDALAPDGPFAIRCPERL